MAVTVATTPATDAFRPWSRPLLLALAMLAVNVAQGQLATPAPAMRQTVSGDFWTEPATLRSLGFEWRISGRR